MRSRLALLAAVTAFLTTSTAPAYADVRPGVTYSGEGTFYRTLAQGSTLQGGGVGHPEPSGPEGRSDTAKFALSDNVVGGPTAGLAGRQACGDLVRPPSGGRGR